MLTAWRGAPVEIVGEVDGACTQVNSAGEALGYVFPGNSKAVICGELCEFVEGHGLFLLVLLFCVVISCVPRCR